jgi:hypothetical protein
LEPSGLHPLQCLASPGFSQASARLQPGFSRTLTVRQKADTTYLDEMGLVSDQ